MTPRSRQLLGCGTLHRLVRPTSVACTDGGDHRVYAAPTCRASGFWHRLELDHAPAGGDPSPWADVWRDHHAGTAVETAWIVWERTLEDAGAPPEHPGTSRQLVLATSEPVPTPARGLPPGIALRPVRSDAEWEACAALSATEHGGDAEAFAWASWFLSGGLRERCDAGGGTWWGAFDGDHVVAHLGVLADAHEGRFQEVGTRASYRRRGLCSALVAASSQAFFAARTDATLVIAAELDSAPLRIYQRLGFRPVSVFDCVGIAAGAQP